MAKPRPHIDADASYRVLEKALLERGHDVTRTPNSWMALEASDEKQLLEASARGRCIFTFNIGDFVHLAEQYPDHHGIILGHQASWTL